MSAPTAHAPSPRRRPTVRVLLAGAVATSLLGVSAVQLAPAAHAADTPQPAIQRYAPTPVPDRIALIPTADPARSQKVSWRSTAETPRAQIMEAPAAFGDVMLDRTDDGKPLPTVDGADYTKIITLDATTAEVDPKTGYKNQYRAVEFKDLKPGTRYSYRVGDGTDPNGWPVSNWSAWEDFTTAETDLKPFSFVYFGDAQNYIDTAVPRVFHQAVLDRPKAKLMIHAGDLVNQTGTSDANLQIQEKEWGEWYGAAGYNNQTRNVLATPGNHEYNSSTAITAFWKPQFPFPENGPKGTNGQPLEAVKRSTYYVDYQGVRYISLDSNPLQNGPIQNDVLAAQTAWFESVLKDPNRPKWTVLTFHHPVYAGTSTRDNKAVRENWNPLIDKYGVDLVLQGHDHVYNRGNQVKDNDAVDPTKSHGAVYSISVSGGKMYQLNAGKNWSDNNAHRRVAAENIQLYQLVDVEQDKLTYQARLANGRFFDGYTVTKKGASATGPKTVQDLKTDPDANQPTAATTNVRISASAANLTSGHELTVTAAVAGAEGSVRFYDGDAPLGDAVALADGKAELRTKALKDGAHALSAVFTPADTEAFAASTSTGLLVTVAPVGLPDERPQTPVVPGPAAPAPAPVPSPASAPGRATPRVSAHVASGSIGRGERATIVVAVAADGRFVPGTVTVVDRTTKRTWKAKAALRGGLVTVTSPRLTAGTHRLAVSYAGSAATHPGTATATVRVARR